MAGTRDTRTNRRGWKQWRIVEGRWVRPGDVMRVKEMPPNTTMSMSGPPFGFAVYGPFTWEGGDGD